VTIFQIVMSTSKSSGSSRLGRDSAAQRLGVKVYAGEKIKTGMIIIRQRGTKYIPGKNVKRGSDDTLYALKDGVISMGYPWYEREKRDYQITINSQDLPDSIDDISDNITQEVISCPNGGYAEFQCTVAFRITPEELSFYRQKGLPLPRYCPNCRHYERLKYRNPMKLYKRTCSNGCGREFETTYAPDRPERVYCEQCYQAEVL
jgi:ribosomal protein L27